MRRRLHLNLPPPADTAPAPAPPLPLARPSPTPRSAAASTLLSGGVDWAAAAAGASTPSLLSRSSSGLPFAGDEDAPGMPIPPADFFCLRALLSHGSGSICFAACVGRSSPSMLPAGQPE